MSVRKFASLIGSIFLLVLYPLISLCYAYDCADRGEREEERRFILCFLFGIAGVIGCGVMWFTPLPRKVIVAAIWPPIYLLGWMLQWRWMLEIQEERIRTAIRRSSV
jgi:hypothetical protein